MGYYIQGPAQGKAAYIIKNYGGQIVDVNDALQAMDNSELAVISVKHNGNFEAAGFCYNNKEFLDFNDKSDKRYTEWLIMDRAKAMRLTNFS